MQKFHSFVCAVSLLGFAACETIPPSNENAAISPESHLISEAQALEHLSKALAVIDGTVTRASATQRSISHVTAVSRADIGRSMTRSGDSQEDEPVVYLVQLGEGEGSAILAADDRLEPIIAIYDTYEVTTEDLRREKLDSEAWRTNENLYVEEDDDYLLGAIGQENPIRDLPDIEREVIRNYVEAPDYGGVVHKKERGWELADYVRPMLTTKWHQNSPFNDRTPCNYPAGCVAIALAQIMAYHEYPRNYCDWTLAKNYNPRLYNESVYNEIARMSEDIGRGCHIKYNFMWSGQSFATPAKAKRFLKHIGYYGTSKENGYDAGLIVSKLKEGCPVFIGALTPENYGHAWVIDGYVRYENTVETYCASNLLKTEVKKKLLVHCNWGWGGSKDGYYASKVFNTGANPVAEDNEIDFSETRGTNSNNYTWWFRLVTYNKPR